MEVLFMNNNLLKTYYVKIFSLVKKVSYYLRLISIKERLILFFVILSSIPLIILGCFSYFKSSKAIENKIEYFSSEIFALSSQNIRISMNIMEENIKELKNNADILSCLKLYKSNKNTLHNVSNELDKVLNSKFIKATIKNCEGAIIVSDGSVIGNSTSYQILRDLKNLDNYIEKAKDAKGSIIWTSDIINNDSYFLVLSNIYNNFTNDILGTLIVVLNESFFLDSYKAVEITESSDLFIANSEGLVISSRDKFKIPLSVKYSNIDVIDKINTKIKEQSTKGTVITKDYMYCYSLIENTDWYIIGTIPFSYITEDSKNLGITIFRVSMFIFILAIILSLLVSMSIISPLRNLEDIIQNAKNGILDISVNDEYNDEISRLNSDFDNMIENIKTLISKVKQCSSRVLQTAGEVANLSATYLNLSEQIAQSMSQIAEGTSEQAVNTLITAAYVNKLSEDINRIEEEVASSSETIDNIKSLSKSAMVAVNSLNQKTIQTGEVAEKIVISMNQLKNDMKHIEHIVDFVRNISKQTNLLSLNASIEAAKAGSAGNGFAVVADQVKKLANQTQESLNTISKVIDEINKKVEFSTNSSYNTKHIIEEQLNSVLHTDNAFKEIYKTMEVFNDKISSFSTAFNIILSSKQKTIESINIISSVSQETAATTEEVTASAQSQISDIEFLLNQANLLNQLAHNLNESISFFKI